ncbi:MAG: 23S rRNA (uridine(2479)-2'-O)-methyltransferase [Bacteroidetes bacterium ADurb.BinA174]|nr:MAG: 23S rRNA (uridine(2479)-2'-O)-methyltransferase [Bacteroidetes bacterium ADurb.BinA174]
MSLSKNKIKYIRSLNEKKYRTEHGTFVAEGKKLVFDLLGNCRCQFLAGSPEVMSEISSLSAEEIVDSTPDELKKASQLKTAPQVIGVFYKPKHDVEDIELSNKLHLVLDGIQDPGNMGTIVRLADWFGIEHIFCSPDTADIYNPKTVQATMGAIARVKAHYLNIFDFLKKNNDLPVFGTFLEGENIYKAELSENGFVVMGNEGKGISLDIQKLVTNKLFIPNYPPNAQTSESLNVAVATAIVCSEFRRRNIQA